ncbi:MAG: cytochrome c biogenesis protein ResB [Fibrobacterota bacterium]
MRRFILFITGMRFALILIAVLIAISIAGVVFPQLNGMFYSPFFIMLLLILAVSMSACIIKRIIKGPLGPRLFSSIFIHIGVILILAGFFTGGKLGEEFIISAVPGIKYKMRDVELSVNDFKILRDSSGNILNYSTYASFRSDENTEIACSLKVNKPFTYNGITFIQHSYGRLKDTAQYYRISTGKYKDETEDFIMNPGDTVKISPNIKITALKFLESPQIDPNSGNISSGPKKNTNPAILIAFFNDRGEIYYRKWLFMNVPQKIDNSEFIVFASYKPVLFPGIKAVYDPGKFLKYLGMIITGLSLIFFYYIHPILRKK